MESVIFFGHPMTTFRSKLWLPRVSNGLNLDQFVIKTSHHIFPLYAYEFRKQSTQELEENEATFFDKENRIRRDLHKYRKIRN